MYTDVSTSNPVVELNKLGGAKLIVATAPSGKAIAPRVGGLEMDGTLLLLASTEPTFYFEWFKLEGVEMGLSKMVDNCVGFRSVLEFNIASERECHL
ncbi:hypothetical protein HDU76_002425 [Blyttiomyces sp. JEL0837]|nr:hypothetical protein HDU76_002425 [Blyttiomyces sp. JEL0837]